MTALIKGKLTSEWLEQEINEGEFVRDESIFRHWITRDGSAGPSGQSGFKAEANRYHLYISHACPWAHRTVIFRRLKQLEEIIGLSVVEPEMLDLGWRFSAGNKQYQDAINGVDYVHQLYTLADPEVTSQVTVPILWDKKQQTIVNNESSEIIRIFNSAFNQLTGNSQDYYPESLRTEIDTINTMIYENINNGVYRCGFATTQKAYEEAFDNLFSALDQVEQRLGQQRYLVDHQITEADWRLFTTLVRFDVVYVGHFKCNLRRIADYSNLFNYLKELYQVPGIADTVHFDYIKRHYYYSHESINPTRIVPKGPEYDLSTPHDRENIPI